MSDKIETEMDLKIKLFDEWIKTQQHLPQKIEKIILLRYLDFCKGNFENAKKILDSSYTLRNKHENIFIKRDPLDFKTQQAFHVMTLLPLPNPTKENYSVLLCRLADPAINKLDFKEFVKAFVLFEDTRLKQPFDGDNGIGCGEVPIVDMSGVSIRHLMKVVISTLRMFMKYMQELHCIRFKHVHIINCTSLLPKLMFILKPFIKAEVYNMMHFHTPNSNTLDEFVAKDLLPNEYGGKAGTIEEIHSDWIKRVEDHRDYLMDNDYWRVDESKRKLN